MQPEHPLNRPQARPNPRPKVLIDQQELARRVRELAGEIERDYSRVPLEGPGEDGAADAPRRLDDPLICVGVLTGSVFFLVDLLEEVVDLPVVVDFFQTSSYGSGTSPGEVRIKKDIDTSIRGRDVLLVEDIVDTGFTLRTILDLLRFRGARSVRLCALLDKAARREVEVPIDYCGFPIDDVFVVGYGLDYDGLYRNLPYIGIMDE
ncbi:MAG TPA: hypoxanthine phosphoribosyltransferase [Thermoanaerobaculia bacterium]|nr:hypoxanthine phosphoribosyltransferase [Thermoanaerobaculia bacterium]